MDRTTATKLIATLISATQSGKLSWRKQLPGEIVDKDHAVSAVYFTSINDTGFRIYRYKWERGDYYAVYDPYALELEPRRIRGVILEVVDDDGSLVESIQDISALRDLFEVVNQHVSNIREKSHAFLTTRKVPTSRSRRCLPRSESSYSSMARRVGRRTSRIESWGVSGEYGLRLGNAIQSQRVAPPHED